ncbi:hypothetical protein [Streptomyces sp. KR80]|uniref:hypothetical protein n=1 Tax=Streptomyces sp. KR80 TaxID=3457426 RepID=UPI003FCFF2E5
MRSDEKGRQCPREPHGIVEPRKVPGAAAPNSTTPSWGLPPHVLKWTAGRPFAWVDDFISAETANVATHNDAPALLLRINPRHGLRDHDFATLARWAQQL